MNTTYAKMMLLTVLCLSSLVWADGIAVTDTADAKDNSGQTTSSTSTDRKARGEMYDKMAQCLKTNKSEGQCEKEASENCKRMGGMKNCGKGMMMGKMGKKRGAKMSGGMMMEGGKMGGGMMGGEMGGDMKGKGNDNGDSSQDAAGDKGMKGME